VGSLAIAEKFATLKRKRTQLCYETYQVQHSLSLDLRRMSGNETLKAASFSRRLKLGIYSFSPCPLLSIAAAYSLTPSFITSKIEFPG
jgi:hypothetical protein